MKGFTLTGTISDFNRLKARLVSEKEDFVVLSSGSAKYIEYNGRKMKFMKKRPLKERVRFQAACRLVSIDAKSNKDLENPPNIIIRTREINKELFKKYVGKDIAGIDIRSCYWNIALREGIISLETYLRFHEQKTERNMAIGNLAKDLQAYIYLDGVLNDIQKFTSQTKDVNRLIRYKTYELYKAIQKLTDNSIMLLKTDEIYLPIDKAAIAKGYIQSQNLMATASLHFVEKSDSHYTLLYNYKKQEHYRIKH